MDEDWDEEIRVSNENSKLNNRDNNNNSNKFGSTFSSFSNNNSNNDENRRRNESDDNTRQSSGFSFGRGRLLNNKSDNYRSNNENFTRYRSPSNQRSYNDSSSSITEYMNIDVRSISTLIGRQGSTISNIRDKCSVKIFVPNRDEIGNQNTTEIKIIGQSKSNIDKARDMIEELLNSSNRYGFKRNNPFETDRSRSKSPRTYFGNTNRSSNDNYSSSFKEESSGFAGFREKKRNTSEFESDRSPERKEPEAKPVTIDWDAVRRAPTQNLSKFKDHPPVVKDFYVEVDEIKAMTKEDVIKFRKENFNIIVDLFKKENLNYLRKNDDDEDKRTPEEKEAYLFENIPKPVKTFEQAFHNFPDILEECKRQNFVQPSPIQSQMWPILLKGKDCIGIAQTGTGKTLAFLLPALIHIDNQTTPRHERLGPNVLVLSPTRELALQIEKEVKKINYKGIKSVCVYGGGDKSLQTDLCTQGVQIVIATPGRLYDLIQSKVINITSVTYLVLDEADRMLDLGFEPQIMKILLDIRPDRQTIMTSATWPEGVRRLATKYLAEPIQLYVGSLDLRAAKTVTQELIFVKSDEEKKEVLMDYIHNGMNEEDKLIVFVGRKVMVDNLSCDLSLSDIKCQSIHGDREQCDREDALEEFKEGSVRILLATDVASRGIDVKDISCVFNYDFPKNLEEYVHRVGRTGRAGRTGKSITLMAREDWKHAKELIEIMKQGEQVVPQDLIDMADRYEAMLKRRAEEGSTGGRGGRGGFNRRNDSGSFGNSSSSRGFNDSGDSSRAFIPRGRRGGRGGGNEGFSF